MSRAKADAVLRGVSRWVVVSVVAVVLLVSVASPAEADDATPTWHPGREGMAPDKAAKVDAEAGATASEALHANVADTAAHGSAASTGNNVVEVNLEEEHDAEAEAEKVTDEDEYRGEEGDADHHTHAHGGPYNIDDEALAALNETARKAILGARDSAATDLVVYGGTPSAVITAVQAARMGKRVVLISPTRYVGGVMTSGLGATDFGEDYSIQGVTREFFQRVMRYYRNAGSWRYGSFAEYEDTVYFDQRAKWFIRGDALYAFEPKVGEQILKQMVSGESRISLVLNQRLDRSRRGVSFGKGKAITSIRMESGRTFSGKVFVDASYEGDLLATAGVRYTKGREARSRFGEAIGGATAAHCFKLNPFNTPGNRASGILPGLIYDDDLSVGAADPNIQAFTYRMTLTQERSNMVPITRPRGYNARQFEFILRSLESGDSYTPVNFAPMPNRKVDSNSQSRVGTNFVNGGSSRWAEASYAERNKIAQSHRNYVLGLWYTLQTNPRVPAATKSAMAGWGLAKDEFTENSHFPRQLYIREARRMLGRYTMTQADVFRSRDTPEPIALGSYWMDSKGVRNYVRPDGKVCQEGDVYKAVDGPYPISYRSLTPQQSQASNLLVSVAVSASNVAWLSMRMEPVFMMMGQAAAAAAAIAIDNNVAVQRVPYQQLKDLIYENGGCTEWGTPPCKFPW